MIIIKDGDLLNSDCTTIMHQANCFKVMGGGIAKSISSKFPNAYQVDKDCNLKPKERLGGFTASKPSVNQRFTIANLYGQYDFGPGLKTNYEMLELSIDKFLSFAKRDVEIDLSKVGIPFNMGCGLAGGDWKEVVKIVSSQSKKHNVDIYAYKL